MAHGEDLYETLPVFIAGDLVVEPHGGSTGCDSGMDVVDAQPNVPDAFWLYVI